MRTRNGVIRYGTCVAIGLALFIAACYTDSTAPTGSEKTPKIQRPVLDLRSRPELSTILTTIVSVRDKKTGKLVEQSRRSQPVTASWVGNYARTKKSKVASRGLPAIFAGFVDGSASFAQHDYSTDPNYTTDPAFLVPVLAVTNGAAGYNYADTTITSDGDVYELYGWAADPSPAPITDAWAYRNGELLAQYHGTWSIAVGGYTLSNQKVGSYDSNGNLVGMLQITVSGGSACANRSDDGTTCGPYNQSNESIGDRLAAPFLLALDKIACYLSPNVAYASSSCLLQSGDFAFHTLALGEGTVSGLAFVMPPFYFIEWGLWTTSLYGLLDCLDANMKKMPRGAAACQSNPRLCTGGGGSTW